MHENFCEKSQLLRKFLPPPPKKKSFLQFGRLPAGPAAHKRALSVLSRFTPFTSLGRRISRYPARSRGAGTRDYISAETRGDFSDRPSGQPLRWGR
ncbi:hypothetical protein ONE63_003726 [Megalurothrips usitatus]|uniref:Uncharacterized protein n=1 Tax=Megalurothrips usitatus TaxID=439358 RepID=A0AAV7X7T4_9NEOP|nr:hypothetical protein ONE63_003726 [Megalurothrips usitatus]